MVRSDESHLPAFQARRLERALAGGESSFSGAYMAVNELRRLLKEQPGAARPETLSLLDALLHSRTHAAQTQRLFLYRALARTVQTVLMLSPDPGLAGRAMEVLRRSLAAEPGSQHRAAAETLGALPAAVPSPPPVCTVDAPVQRRRWVDVLDRAQAADVRWVRFYGRSLVAGIKGCDRYLVVKFGAGEAACSALALEIGWMDCLQKRCGEFGDGFRVPEPLAVGRGRVFCLAPKGLPVQLPAGLQNGAGLYAAAFWAPSDYFRYPNSRRVEQRLPAERFKAVMFCNARLLGAAAGRGIIHTAPIPLFHNRLQIRRRTDQGLYEWPRGGRLDRWLFSCRYPNFGLSGLRDFEHLEVYNGRPQKLYFHIGCHLLGLVLVTASYFRHKSPDLVGWRSDGTPQDARFLFDRQLLVEMLHGLLSHYHEGFVDAPMAVQPPIDFNRLAERIVEEMGVDRYMTEILRTADQAAMTDAAFQKFLSHSRVVAPPGLHPIKGAGDITLYSGPHLGGFNDRISIPELIHFLETAAAWCMAGRYQRANGRG